MATELPHLPGASCAESHDMMSTCRESIPACHRQNVLNICVSHLRDIARSAKRLACVKRAENLAMGSCSDANHAEKKPLLGSKHAGSKLTRSGRMSPASKCIEIGCAVYWTSRRYVKTAMHLTDRYMLTTLTMTIGAELNGSVLAAIGKGTERTEA